MDLLAALVGALIAGAFGMAGVVATARRSSQHWVRDQRLAAYARFLEAAEAAYVTVVTRYEATARVSPSDQAEELSRVSSASTVVILLGPDDAAEAARDVVRAIGAALTSAVSQEEWLRLREDLRDTRHAFLRTARGALGA